MPRSSILSAADRDSLLAMPDVQDELIRHYTFTEADLAIIQQHRGSANRLGFAVQLCYMRHPGVAFGADYIPFPPLLQLVAAQLKMSEECWGEYDHHDQTRREHLVELQSVFGFQVFGVRHYRAAVQGLDDLARQTDKGVVLAMALIQSLRSQSILLPSVSVIERICAEAVTRSNRRLFTSLTEHLTEPHRLRLDALLSLREGSKSSVLAWLRQSPSAPNAKHILEHIDRLTLLRALSLPDGVERPVHQNRLLKLAREGGQMTSQHLRDLEPLRRDAILIAVALEAKATLTVEIIDLNDRIIGALFSRAKRSHEQQFQQSGRAINEKVRLYGRIGSALLAAKQSGSDPFAAIEAILSWDKFTQSVTEAQKLAGTEDFDYLHRLGDGYTQIRRYAPAFLDSLTLKAAPAAQGILDAVDLLKLLNAGNSRKIPKEAPTDFVKKRWETLVLTGAGMDRRFYELCALSELKNALRSGDVWVQGSRQFKDFEEYLIPSDAFAPLTRSGALPLAVSANGDQYLSDRLDLLSGQMETVDRMAKANELPDAVITEAGLKITPLSDSVPDAADTLMQRAYSLLPRVKITELLMEVDEWAGFTRHFTHVKSGAAAGDRTLLLSAILADAINLGLTKMAESCPGTTYAKLSWLQAWHIRDETYSSALAELVNAQLRHPFAGHWGEGRHLPRTDNGSGPAALRRRAVTPTRSMAVSRAFSSTPTSPTSTRRSTPGSSMLACVTPLMCWTACSTTSPTCVSRSTTPTRPASPITSSR